MDAGSANVVVKAAAIHYICGCQAMVCHQATTAVQDGGSNPQHRNMCGVLSSSVLGR